MPLRSLALLALAALTGCASAFPDEVRRATPESKAALEKRKAALYAQHRYDETGHERLGPPQPGEWLDDVAEPGQDEEDYARTLTNKRTAARSTIAVVAVGALSPRTAAVESSVRAFLCVFLQLPVTEERRLELPPGAEEPYEAEDVLEQVSDSAAEGALVTLGILDHELAIEGFGSVAGVGAERWRAGVYAFPSFEPDEETPPARRDALYRTRALRIVAHEASHVLGLQHCVFYACLMNGIREISQGDRVPLHLCPVCVAKLASNLGFDPLARERDLAAFFRQAKLDAEAAWSEARIARLEARGR